MPTEQAMSEQDARVLAADFRQRFRNAEAFEAAWGALFELKTAITLSLARRFLGEELAKYKARMVGFEEPASATQQSHAESGRSDLYVCPGCDRRLDVWAKGGHAADCRHVGCYELEVRFREAKYQRSLRGEPVEAGNLGGAIAAVMSHV